MKITAFLLLLTAAGVVLADEGRTLTTTDGGRYTNIAIVDLQPNGVVIISDSGLTTIAYSKLPKEIQSLYSNQDSRVEDYLKQGIDGLYADHEGQAFAGAFLELRGGHFQFSKFTDVVIASARTSPQPTTGKFSITGDWLILDHPKIHPPARKITVIDNRLSLVEPKAFKEWKETGKLDSSRVLMLRKSK